MLCPYCNQEHPDEIIDCPSTGKKLKRACNNLDCSLRGEYIYPLSQTSCICCGKPLPTSPDFLSASLEFKIQNVSEIIREAARQIKQKYEEEHFPDRQSAAHDSERFSTNTHQDYSFSGGTRLNPNSSINIHPFRDPKTGKYGYSRMYEIVIPAQYEQAFEFSPNGTAQVTMDGKRFLIDEKGNIINGSYYVVPIDGGFRLPVDCSSLELRYNRETGKYGYSYQNKIVIPAVYDSATNFDDGVASVKKNGKSYQLREVGDCVYEEEW